MCVRHGDAANQIHISFIGVQRSSDRNSFPSIVITGMLIQSIQIWAREHLEGCRDNLNSKTGVTVYLYQLRYEMIISFQF